MNYLESVFSQNETFYPTPIALCEKLYDKIIFSCKQRHIPSYKYQRLDILEPSAGKGDLVDYYYHHIADSYAPHEQDVIERDTQLRHILNGKEHCRLIGSDFLSFDTEKHYDAIIMNPPFNEGAKHLLKALNLAKKNGGNTYVSCILNAETLQNPFSNERKELIRLLRKYNADIEYVQNAFADAERTTEVTVAVVTVYLPETIHFDSLILEDMKKAEEYTEDQIKCTEEIVSANNYIDVLVSFYEREVKTCVRFIHEYLALVPSFMSDVSNESQNVESSYVKLEIAKHEICNYSDLNYALKRIRRKYWDFLFRQPEFTKMLTSDMQNSLYNSVSEMQEYDFSKHNIEIVQKKLIDDLISNIENSIISLFEELTCEHTYFDGSENIHYYNGWKSNKAHKVNKKVIIPMYGMFYEWKSSTRYLNCYELTKKISDLEKVFNYLSDGTTEGQPVDIVVYWADSQKKNKNLHFKYFDVSIYKKGTCHIKFTDEAVVDALNIYVGKHKGWLPPCYGKVAYDDMDAEEQAVVDDFQGREEYEKVFANPSKYIFETSAILSLPETV